MRRKRKLYLSIYNYNNDVVCNLYDNQSDISGQATNVHIITERNGFKELNFDLPTTCMTETGETENYRLQYLIAEYRIKAIDDKGIDWYTISEPKITRNNYSKNISVKASHISQLLKHKNLDLELSDEEGNATGVAEDILAAILAGTNWQVGHVGEQNERGEWHTFLEDDGSAKQRTVTGEAGTGSLAFIEKLCDAFEAKPVYRIEEDGNNYVDILPMNPFAKIQPEQIPELLRDTDAKVIELNYNRNIHDLIKTINTENMATRLYAYGSSGDMNGACTLQTALHEEWNFVVVSTGPEYRFDIDGINFYFSGDVAAGDELVWSDMDITSRTYIYNKTKAYAYRVYEIPNGSTFGELIASDPIQTENEFAFLLGLKYYDDVGLMTEEQFQNIANFQQTMPEDYRIIKERSEQFIEGESDLSKMAEHNTGLLRLSVAEYDADDKKFYINTSEGENGVIYRSDYEKAERRYFQWHVTSALQENGDPVTGTPSVLFIVHDTDPVTYDMTYLKEIWDTFGKVVNDEDKPKDFEYSTSNYPTAFTVWNEIREQPGDRYYLFCTNSMAGYLGSRLSSIEGLYQELSNVTMKHPVTFFDGTSSEARPSPSNAEYEWLYVYELETDGTLYFSWKNKFDDTLWHEVHIEDGEPSTTYTTGDYYYNIRRKNLYRQNDSTWEKIEDKQITTSMFESVIYYCRKRDELFRGIYNYYFYDYPKSMGNYAIFDGYNSYWLFKLKAAANNILLDYVNSQRIFTDVTFVDDEPVISGDVAATTQHAERVSLTFPTDNELATKNLYPGSIASNGSDQKTKEVKYRTSFIPVEHEKTYYCGLPVGSVVYLYNDNKEYATKLEFDIKYKNFTTSATTGFIRVVVPSVGVSYIRYISASGTDEQQAEASDNLLKDRPYVYGDVDNNGQEKDIDRYSTYNVSAYENTTYHYYLPPTSSVYYYDINSNFLSYDNLTNEAAAGSFTTPANTSFMRFVTSVNSFDGYYVHIHNYQTTLYKNKEAYEILTPVEGRGELIGITPLTKKFADTADTTYNIYLKELRDTQKEVEDKERNLATSLGDMLKDGRWQDTNYIKGDEKRLYDDAMYMHRQIAEPETEYSFTYLNMYGVQNERYYEEHDASWPDIDITYVAHLIDMESKTNCWAYIDKIDMWYDQEWKTTIEIDTKLTLASRHGFTDVIARIAEVAKQIKAKQSLYDMAATGRISGSRLKGVIDLNQTYLNGGASNWYNDDKGNLIFEASDGLSAVQIGGRGIGVSAEKNADGSWLFRSAITGYGSTADVMTAGTINADRIDAGTITLEKLASNVGKELEIGSNKALMMYATEDGTRPAGSLKTTDGYIEIAAGAGNTPAKINIVSGGELNLNGGKVSVYSQGSMDISSGGKFVLKAQLAESIDDNDNRVGLFIDSEQGINFGGGRIKAKMHGDTMDVQLKASYIELGQSNNASIIMDDVGKKITVQSNETIELISGNTLSLLSRGTINIGHEDKYFSISSDMFGGPNGDIRRAYMRCGRLNILDNTSDGVYLGTDGLNIGKKEGNYVKATADGIVEVSGKIIVTEGEIGSWLIGEYLYSGSGENRVGLGASGDYRIWAGNETPANAPFSVKKDGTLDTIKGNIGGWYIRSDYIGSNNTKNGSTVGMAHIASGTAITFWAGGAYNGAGDNQPKFWVKNDGTMRAILGNIGGWYIGSDYIGNADTKNGSNVGMAFYNTIAEGTTKVFWSGGTYNGTGANTPKFYVQKDGYLYATNAYIQGTMESSSIVGCTINIGNGNFTVDQYGNLMAKTGTFKGTVEAGTISGCSIIGGTIKINENSTYHGGYTFQVKADGKMQLGDWYIDPNDFAGPIGADGTPNSSAGGFVQINCNNNSNPRIQVGSGGKFRVYQDGSLYFNNQGPAINITSFSSSAIAGYDSNGNYISASFFSSSRLGVGENGSSVYPTYHGSPYTASGSTDIYNTIYRRGDYAATAKGVALDSRIIGTKIWNATVIRNDNKKKTLMIDCADPYDAGSSAGYATGYAAVTVSAAGWVNGSNVVTASNEKSVTVNLPTISLTGGTSFSSHKTTVYASGGGSSGYVASLEVDATSEYNAGSSAGAATSAPSGTTLGSKVTGTVWNVNIQRGGGYSTVGKTIDLASAYSDARDGYYTAAQYAANYNKGWNDCIDTCTSHTDAHWGMTHTTLVLYTNTTGTFVTWSSNGGYKGGYSGTLYEIPSKK